jgi:GNAT superfamily N-acetyltransferase
VRGLLPLGDLSGPLTPRFLQALAEGTGRRAQGSDMLAVTTSRPVPPAIRLTSALDQAHPRIARALRYRDEVRAWQTDGGVLLIGRGIAGRWEVAIEVDPDHRGKGLGRDLAAAARHLVPGGAPLWAQIAPGNAASVRAFLAAGFTPVGAEAQLTADPTR